MTTPHKLNEFNHAEDPARHLLEQLGWTYVPSEQLEAERPYERDVLLKDRLRAALLRLNDGLTGAQAERVIYDLERADGIGMARNRLVHEYLTYGITLTVEGPDGRDTRTVRFFDFDDPVGGSTSSWSRPSSASGAATTRATPTTTRKWSSPTWCSSSTASHWW